MRRTKALLKAMLPYKLMDVALWVNRNYLMSFRRDSYSSEGEDILLSKIFEGKDSPGFFVDIGAHHPVSTSNTYLLYKRGWRGINIEPVPGTALLFQRRRPRDVSLEIGISEKPGLLNYYMFEVAAENTFSEEQRNFVLNQGRLLLKTVPVRVERLDSVLSQHVPEGTGIDLMNVDVEGHELQVLRSNDWARFRPSIICLEMLMVRTEEVRDHPLGRFLGEVGYRFFAKLDNSALFQERDFYFSDRDFEDNYGSAHVGLVRDGRNFVRVLPR